MSRYWTTVNICFTHTIQATQPEKTKNNNNMLNNVFLNNTFNKILGPDQIFRVVNIGKTAHIQFQGKVFAEELSCIYRPRLKGLQTLWYANMFQKVFRCPTRIAYEFIVSFNQMIRLHFGPSIGNILVDPLWIGFFQ